MRKLNTLKSRILSTLKKHDESIDVESIMSSTLLPRFAVEHVLDCLKQEGMTPRIYDSHPDPSVVQLVVTKPVFRTPCNGSMIFLRNVHLFPGRMPMVGTWGVASLSWAVLLTDS
jgi:hypothetical protein